MPSLPHVIESLPIQQNFDALLKMIAAITGQSITQGAVSAAAAITSGSDDFSVNRPVTGTYDVTFTDSFDEAPAVSADLEGTDAAVRTWRLTNRTTGGFRLLIFDDSSGTGMGGAVNAAFTFIAAGPRT